MCTQTLKQVKSTLITACVDSHNINCVLPENIKKIQICIYKKGLLKILDKASLNENKKIEFYLKEKHLPQNIILKVKTTSKETLHFSLNKYCHSIDDLNLVCQDTHDSKHYFLIPITEEDLLLDCMKKLFERAFESCRYDATSPTFESFQTSQSIDIH